MDEVWSLLVLMGRRAAGLAEGGAAPDGRRLGQDRCGRHHGPAARCGESRRRHGDNGQQKLDGKGERRAEAAQPAQQRRSALAFSSSPLRAPLTHEIQVGGMNGPAL
jgi:hypothetical protein